MKRKKQQTHSSISRIQSIASTDEARETAWGALVRGAIVKVWLADTGNWQVAITETLETEAKEKGISEREFRKAFTENKYGELP